MVIVRHMVDYLDCFRQYAAIKNDAKRKDAAGWEVEPGAVRFRGVRMSFPLYKSCDDIMGQRLTSKLQFSRDNYVNRMKWLYEKADKPTDTSDDKLFEAASEELGEEMHERERKRAELKEKWEQYQLLASYLPNANGDIERRRAMAEFIEARDELEPLKTLMDMRMLDSGSSCMVAVVEPQVDIEDEKEWYGDVKKRKKKKVSDDLCANKECVEGTICNPETGRCKKAKKVKVVEEDVVVEEPKKEKKSRKVKVVEEDVVVEEPKKEKKSRKVKVVEEDVVVEEPKKEKKSRKVKVVEEVVDDAVVYEVADDVVDLCANKECVEGTICNPETGRCKKIAKKVAAEPTKEKSKKVKAAEDLCANKQCVEGSKCNPETGRCKKK
jgi:hypothetical protein